MNKQGIALWILICAVLLLDIGIHSVPAQNSSSKVLKARELQIIDSKGSVRIDLTTTTEGNAAIKFNDANGKPREALLTAETGGYLGLLDATGHPTLLLDGSSSPDVAFYKSEKAVAVFGAPDGGSVLTLGDTAGHERALLAYDPQKEESLVRLQDATGSQKAEMNQVSSSSLIDVTDKQGFLRAELKCASGDQPSLTLCDSSGGIAWTQTDQTGQ